MIGGKWLFRGAENSTPQRFHAPPPSPSRAAPLHRMRLLYKTGQRVAEPPNQVCRKQADMSWPTRTPHHLPRASSPTAFAAVFPAFHYVEPLASSHRDGALSFFTNLNPRPPALHSLLRLVLSCSLRFCRACFLHPPKVFVDRSIPHILYF